jgi:uncharacterized ferritin-like protein (DUF455 family)
MIDKKQRDMASHSPSLATAATGVLNAADPAAKVRLSRSAAEAWRNGGITAVGHAEAPDRPARPSRPVLTPPQAVPRRGIATAKGRVALLHALAHIELNAIDLAWDLIARFTDAGLPRAFYDDWVSVAVEEAGHFALLAERLAALGAFYGDLPAHDGLWRAAENTKHDLLARLAVVPLVLEARGLDVTPAMIDRLTAVGDRESVAVLEVIYRDEIGHVAIGKRWFDWLCARDARDPAATWQALVRRYFKGRLKPPFNDAARAAAGLSAEDYTPLAAG